MPFSFLGTTSTRQSFATTSDGLGKMRLLRGAVRLTTTRPTVIFRDILSSRVTSFTKLVISKSSRAFTSRPRRPKQSSKTTYASTFHGLPSTSTTAWVVVLSCRKTCSSTRVAKAPTTVLLTVGIDCHTSRLSATALHRRFRLLTTFITTLLSLTSRPTAVVSTTMMGHPIMTSTTIFVFMAAIRVILMAIRRFHPITSTRTRASTATNARGFLPSSFPQRVMPRDTTTTSASWEM
mmetsp:Transcript_17333/g.45243  ORF Transcript_17333/g.45243 Transcript_17333/m.45243 type:complete len:236 (-) Transcript_17333:393-1100(-)